MESLLIHPGQRALQVAVADPARAGVLDLLNNLGFILRRGRDLHDRQLRHLMYRDWSAFEQFFVEILKCNSLTALKPITHRYETFLQTLLREVEKRAVLQTQAA